MKRSIFFAVCCAMFWAMASPPDTAAHGTDYRVLEAAPVIAVDFFYSDREPMRYAEVLVFSPENDQVEYQNGRTDKNGRFAFIPEKAGEWRIKVNDGMGHAVQASISVKPDEAGQNAGDRIDALAEKQPPAAGQASTLIKIIFGLSLLLNIFLGLYAWKNTHNRPKTGGADS